MQHAETEVAYCLVVPAIIIILLWPGLNVAIRSGNRNFLLFLIPLLIDTIYLLAAYFLSGPSINDYHDHAYATPITLFGLLELPAIAVFVFCARANIWSALWFGMVGLIVWYFFFFAGLYAMTDGRAII